MKKEYKCLHCEVTDNYEEFPLVCKHCQTENLLRELPYLDSNPNNDQSPSSEQAVKSIGHAFYNTKGEIVLITHNEQIGLELFKCLESGCGSGKVYDGAAVQSLQREIGELKSTITKYEELLTNARELFGDIKDKTETGDGHLRVDCDCVNCMSYRGFLMIPKKESEDNEN